MTNSSTQQRMERLWASKTAQISFAGNDSIETRPSFMGSVHDFLTENKAGVAIRRVFFAGMAALALSSAMAATVNHDVQPLSNGSPTHFTDDIAVRNIDTETLFLDKTKYDKVFKALAEDTGLNLVSGDINSHDSLQKFAENLVDKGVATGYDVANSLVNRDNDNSPAVVQFLSGVDATGKTNKIAAISYDSYSNKFLGDVFGSLESINFGEDVNNVVEKATWIHETMHVLIKNAEQTGLESWKSALMTGNFKAYDTWRESVQYQLSHPDVRDLIEKEVNGLKVSVVDEYDATPFITEVREIQNTDQYIIYHENMADGLMSAKFLQDGYSISEGVANTRNAHAAKDPLHDTSIGQHAISDHLSEHSLHGKNANELASITAKTIQSAMGYNTDGWNALDNQENDGLEKLVGGEQKPKDNLPEELPVSAIRVGTLGVNEDYQPVTYEPIIADRVQHAAFTVSVRKNNSHELIVPINSAPLKSLAAMIRAAVAENNSNAQTDLTDYRQIKPA